MKSKLVSSFKRHVKSLDLFPSLEQIIWWLSPLGFTFWLPNARLLRKAFVAQGFVKSPGFFALERRNSKSLMILLVDDDLWSVPPQRGFLQELLQFAGYAGCRGVSGVIWDPVSIWGG